MNCVHRAVANKKHISRDVKLNTQTWIEFKEAALNKRIFIYGAGELLDLLFDQYLKDTLVEAIIDNDKLKQGIAVCDYNSFIKCENVAIQEITNEKILESYKTEEILVLIASINHYEEIAEKLREKNIYSVYIGLIMCSKDLEKIGSEEYTSERYLEDSLQKPVNEKKLIFFELGRYCGHGKRIIEALLAIRKDLDIVWITRKRPNTFEKRIRFVSYYNKKKYILEVGTAGFWFSEGTGLIWPLVKRKEQKYIELKHWASITLKDFGIITEKRNYNYAAIKNLEKNGKIIDYLFVGSPFDERTCREGFGATGEFVYVGSPRSDILFKGLELKKEIYKLLGLDETVHTILYAPTFREDNGFRSEKDCKVVIERTQLDFFNLKNVLEHRFGGVWKIILRFHPFRNKVPDGYRFPEYTYDMSNYSDGEELVAASDIVITDYSSIMFEPAFVRKPVFLYAPDRELYIRRERGLLIDYDELPFPRAESNEELTACIEKFHYEEYKRNVDIFFKKYGVNEDGHASERAAAFVNCLIEEA